MSLLCPDHTDEAVAIGELQFHTILFVTFCLLVCKSLVLSSTLVLISVWSYCTSTVIGDFCDV